MVELTRRLIEEGLLDEVQGLTAKAMLESMIERDGEGAPAPPADPKRFPLPPAVLLKCQAKHEQLVSLQRGLQLSAQLGAGVAAPCEAHRGSASKSERHARSRWESRERQEGDAVPDERGRVRQGESRFVLKGEY